MPTISEFFGIFILMYVREHLPPHFHARYQGQEVQIRIDNGEIIKGTLSPRALRLIEEWRQLHVKELQDNWDRAMRRIMPKKIEPLE